jgi:hypothetical protein
MHRRRATSGRRRARGWALVCAAAVALAGAGCKAQPKRPQFKGEDPLLSPSSCVDEVKPASARTLGKGGSGRQTKAGGPTNADLASEYRPSRSEAVPQLGEPTATAPAAGLQLRAPEWAPADTVRRVAGESPAPGALVLDFDQGQTLLTARGASEFRLERVEGGWEFSCRVAATGRRYLARNSNYLAALQSVLEQIDRDGRP